MGSWGRRGRCRGMICGRRRCGRWRTSGSFRGGTSGGSRRRGRWRRRIGGLIGSRAGRSASRYVSRLRRHLEMTVPWRNEGELVDRGLATDAEATLCDDFGLFRPLEKDLWSADAFVVAQHDGALIAEKEPT